MPRAYTPAELAALCRDMHPTLDMQARGALLASANEEPDEALTLAADRYLAFTKVERAQRRAVLAQVAAMDAGLM